MKNLHFILITISIIGFSCELDPCECEPSNQTGEIILQPGAEEGKDAFVENYPYDEYRNRNFGDSEELSAISWTSGGEPFVVRSFIDFNLDTLPDTVTIDSVKLSLFVYGNEWHGYGHDTLGGSNEFYLQKVISSWDEHSVTWNNQPEITQLNQVLLASSNHPFQDCYRVDITELAKDIHENPSESFGLMLSLRYEVGYRRVFFASSDVEEEHKRPKLEIYYSVEK